MGKFGQEAVREVLIDNKSIIEDIRRREELEAEATLKAALGNFVLARTIDEISQSKNHVDFSPYKPPRQFIGRKNIGQVHLTNLGFDGDFDPSKIALHARGDSISGWMNYSLKITKENRDIVDVCNFTASKYDKFDNLEISETHLWKYEDEVNTPIEFQSEDYEFVKNIAGLFLPGALGDLERLENER